MIPLARLPDGETVPALGQGTWKMGERPVSRAREIAALRQGVELGMTLIDTAEMYGSGACETLVGEAIEDLRDDVFLVSKVYPHNASRAGVAKACADSLRRLKTDRLDLYLLHWRGQHPLAETVRGFEDLRRKGMICHWGVSNFDTDDMAEIGGDACAANQILYNVARRGPEWDLLPAMRARKIPVMAYSPVEQGRLPATGALTDIGRGYGASAYQVALAWLLHQDTMIAIPKAADEAHVAENRKAAELTLTEADLAAVDRAFRPPSKKTALDLL